MSVRIRPIEKKDVDEAANICSQAFVTLHQRALGRGIDFADLMETKMIFNYFFSNPKFVGIVAEDDAGNVIGSNWLDIRDEVASIGPISVSPNVQLKGTGRYLMQEILEIAKKRKFASIRLVQEAFNLVALSLYMKLGFLIQDMVTVYQGPLLVPYSGKLQVRILEEKDVEKCAEMHKKIVGVERANSIREASLNTHKPSFVVTTHDGKIVGYTTGFYIAGYAIAENSKNENGKEEDVVHALYTDYSKRYPEELCELKVIGRLNPKLALAALDWGLKIQRNLTIMSIGEYKPPSTAEGIYIPSIGY